MKKIWLDGRVKASLKESVPMIGAPEAWAAGYQRRAASRSRCSTPASTPPTPTSPARSTTRSASCRTRTPSDINGHGTHVASTIVGTGAASDGVNKGVAPGADLIVGKVLGGVDGYGADSWVLAGMQWAAESGADIVSMSLGDPTPSDGSDPMSMAVDNLTAQYGSLFVIAAGNAGPESISAPGAAASALTVGAVDKQDNLAYFSSTGPLIGTGAHQAGHHRPRRRHQRRLVAAVGLRRRPVQVDQRHLDGDPARVGRGGDPVAAAPDLDRRSSSRTS